MTTPDPADDSPALAAAEEAAARARRAGVHRALRFAGAASLGLLITIALFGLAARFEFFSGGVHVNFALVLGIVFTILLGVGLMALSFYSSRSGADDGVLTISDDLKPGAD